MPAILPYVSRRRIGSTPTAHHKIVNFHDKALDLRGFQELNLRQSTASRTDRRTRNSSGKTSMSTKADGAETSQRKTELVDLPDEIQKQIFSFAKHADLIALSIVSRRMRDVAASILYRNFHIVFPDDDDPVNDYPIDSLASGLETFVTSDYDYARYLRHIVLEALSPGIKGELAYRHYLLEASCGKFMNTLLLVTLRKARALEEFRWDIRVELSREVFKVLHNIQSLQHLHIRMQAGDSIHVVAPPLPLTSPFASVPSTPYLPSPPPLTHHNNMAFVHPLPPSFSPPGSLPPTSKNVVKRYHAKHKLPVLPKKGPPTISKFFKLKTLSILDMDSHEYLDEIKICIENSSSTLETLQLSFSEYLANKSKKPVPDVVSDSESDIEDEFGQIIPPPGAVIDPAAPSKALKAQEEKRNQEAALGKIFGHNPLRQHEDEEEIKETKKQKAKDDRTSKSVGSFVKFFTKFMSQVKPGREDTAEAKEAKELIEKATRMYLDIQAGKTSDDSSKEDATSSSTSSKVNLTTISSSDKIEGEGEDIKDEPGLFDDKVQRPNLEAVDSEVSRPEDIDIEVPEEVLDFESGIETETATPHISTPQPLILLPDPSAGLTTPRELLSDKERQILADLEDILAKTSRTEGDAPQDWFAKAKAMNEDRKKTEYIRATRGLALKTLSLHNMPVRTSILNKAIDFSILQNLTLLGVGPQVPIWNLLEKENKETPLKLRKIHTDNVTVEFLNVVSQLKCVEELYMRERKPKRGVEKDLETTPRAITIEFIRKAVLRKHAATLKILVLRNDKGKEWDLDVKAVMLLCHNATELKELTVSFSNEAMHTFLQFFQGLRALHALHILAFRHPDNCDFSRHQIPRLMIDNISNYPEMKLEYIAFLDNVERLVRRKTDTSKEADAKISNIKEREKAVKKAKKSLHANLLGTLDPEASHPIYDWEDSSSEDETEKQYGRSGLRLETYGCRVSDVVGVRIFEKGILSSTL